VEGDSEPCGLSGYQAVVLDGTCASSSYGGLACFAACDAGIDRISAFAIAGNVDAVLASTSWHDIPITVSA